MEVYVVKSLVDLRRLRQFLRHFPVVLFSGGYVRVRVQVDRMDCLIHSHLFERILAEFGWYFHSDYVPQEMVANVACLTECLLTLKRMVSELTTDLNNGNLLVERRYELIGHAGQIAHQYLAFATGDFEDCLFKVTKAAVSCANSGLDILARNPNNERRWGKLIDRLNVLEADIGLLLNTPVLLC